MNNQTPPSSLLWFYFQNDQALGPISFDGLKALKQSGSLDDQSLVIAEGDTEWVALISVIPPVDNRLSSSPPALPPEYEEETEEYAPDWMHRLALFGSASLAFLLLMIPVGFLLLIFWPLGIVAFVGLVVGLGWGIKKFW